MALGNLEIVQNFHGPARNQFSGNNIKQRRDDDYNKFMEVYC
jgi:hypothetical protein